MHILFHNLCFRCVGNGRVVVGSFTGLVDYAKVFVESITGLVDYAKVFVGSPRFVIGNGRFAVECFTGNVDYGNVFVGSTFLNIYCAFFKDRRRLSPI